MSKVVKAFKLIFNPSKLIVRLNEKKLGRLFPNKFYLKRAFRFSMGKKLNLKNPKTFCEKLQWLKLYNRNPEYTKFVDKYEVKEYVAEKLGEEYVIPTLGVWDKFEDIDFDSLPNQFVLKCTHDSGGLVICKDKASLDIDKARKKIKKALKRNYYLLHREWPYKNVKRRIIAEKYMVDESGYDLKDYKFFCFNGEVKMFFIERDRAKGRNGHKVDFFDANKNHLPITVDGYPNTEPPYFFPNNFEKMKEFASELSKGIPQVRVDFYNINGQVYFGEMTFFHASGMAKFEPEEWDYKLGEWIDLSLVKGKK